MATGGLPISRPVNQHGQSISLSTAFSWGTWSGYTGVLKLGAGAVILTFPLLVGYRLRH